MGSTYLISTGRAGEAPIIQSILATDYYNAEQNEMLGIHDDKDLQDDVNVERSDEVRLLSFT